MGIFFSRRNELQINLAKECKDRLCKVNESTGGLVRSLDAMHATAQMLVKCSSTEDISNDEMDNASGKGRGFMLAVARLLVMVERVLLNEKETLVQSVNTFTNFTINNAGAIFQTGSGEFRDLSPDIYKSDQDIWNFTEQDSYIGIIQTENEHLKQEQRRHAQTIEILQNESQGLQLNANKMEVERNQSLERIELTEKELQKVQGKHKKLQTFCNDIKVENNALKEKVSSLKDLEEKIKCIADENVSLHGKNDDLENLCTDYKLQLEHIKLQNDSIDKSLVIKDQEITEIKKRVENFEELNLKLTSEMSQLKEEKVSIEEDRDEYIANITSELESLKQENEESQIKSRRELREKDENIDAKTKCISDLQQMLRSTEEQSNELQALNLTLTSNISELKQENQSIQKDKDKSIASLNNELQSLKQINEEKQRKCTSELKEKDENIDVLTKSLSDLQQMLRNTEEKISELQAHNLNLTSEISKLKEEIISLQKSKEKESKELIEQCREKEEKIAELEKVVEEIMRKKTIKVQLFCQQTVGWTASVEEELIRMLKFELRSVDDKLELDFFKTTRPSDVLPNIPVLLICITISRLGTDVTNATQGISLAANTALLIFHHKDVHALPTQDSERVLTAKELQGVGGIFDMAFKSDKGIYSCDMNNNTIASLVTFLRRQAP